MKKTIKFCFYIIIAFLTISCNNELDVDGEYEDITVVYSIIEPGNQRQFVKINRTFLSKESALVVAQIPDSSTYNYKLNVTIQEFNSNNQPVNIYHLDTITVPKDDGIFYGGSQVLYYFDKQQPARIDKYGITFTYRDTIWIDTDNSLKLIIQNPKTGKIAEASTNLVPNFTISKPSISSFMSFIGTGPINVEMKSAPHGKRYEVMIRFFYREVDINNITDTVSDYIDWKLGIVKSTGISGGENLLISYIPYTLYSRIAQKIPIDDNKKRFHGIFTEDGRIDVQLIVKVGADELSTYIDVHGPSGSIIQERPQYTNISNGIGIFSSKRTIVRNYFLNIYSVDALKNSIYTKDLNFQ